jgi:hypothetical protein
MLRHHRHPSLAIAAILAAASPAVAETVYWADPNNGFFTPFNRGNAATVRYGDSGWLGGPKAPPVPLASITFELAVLNSLQPGTTDLVITFNDGDPSGLVFGSGTALFTTTIREVELPAAGIDPVFFTLTVPLEGVSTLGNFNDVGWSIRCENFDYDGQFGFRVSNCKGQFAGFFTNNASFFNGSSWSLFSFGPDPCLQIASLAVRIDRAKAAPCPADLDGDGRVDGVDLGILLSAWGPAASGTRADIDGNGLVDGADLAAVLNAWGPCG